MVDLHKGARPDERFHVQQARPVPCTIQRGPYRQTSWTNIFLPDGYTGSFVSTWIWKLQWYRGTAKCDGTRTYMLNKGELGEPTAGYVMTTTPKELHAFRWRSKGPGDVRWDNMGGS